MHGAWPRVCFGVGHWWNPTLLAVRSYQHQKGHEMTEKDLFYADLVRLLCIGFLSGVVVAHAVAAAIRWTL